MAKRQDQGDDGRTGKAWREGDLIDTFNLTRIKEEQTALMTEWLDVKEPEFSPAEQLYFDKIHKKAFKSIEGWNEEDLKIKFLGPILDLGTFDDDDKVIGYFDKVISATVDGIKLTVKSDFMFARGILDVFKTPYFHFQEYKPHRNPTGDSMAQLIQAFLIAQEKNKNDKPIYGVEIIGKQWTFVIMESRKYCLSKSFDSVDREELLTIISILRKFKTILYERLIN